MAPIPCFQDPGRLGPCGAGPGRAQVHEDRGPAAARRLDTERARVRVMILEPTKHLRLRVCHRGPRAPHTARRLADARGRPRQRGLALRGGPALAPTFLVPAPQAPRTSSQIRARQCAARFRNTLFRQEAALAAVPRCHRQRAAERRESSFPCAVHWPQCTVLLVGLSCARHARASTHDAATRPLSRTVSLCSTKASSSASTKMGEPDWLYLRHEAAGRRRLAQATRPGHPRQAILRARA